MPTKRTASGNTASNKRRKVEATSKSKSPAGSAPPTQQSQEELRQWLDKADTLGGPIFSTLVSRRKGGKKAKSTASTVVKTLRLSDKDHLDAKYAITPLSRWSLLQKYKKFTVSDETYSTGDCVFVKHTEGDHPHDVANDWKAQVHEVRALDENHVYLLVSWLEKPEDLPGGRRPYHGKTELVPSNKMDIIDAMSVNGGLSLVYWDETDDGPNSMPHPEQWYWRQTFDQDKQVLSELRLICKCELPQNADDMIIRCSNERCGTWLHASCLAEDAMQLEGDNFKKKPKPKKTTKSTSSSQEKDEATDLGEQSLFKNKDAGQEAGSIAGLPELEKAEDTATETDDKKALLEIDEFSVEVRLVGEKQMPTIITTNKVNGGVAEKQVHCLLCHEPVT